MRALHSLQKPLHEDGMALLAAVEGGRIGELSLLMESLGADSVNFKHVRRKLSVAPMASDHLLRFVMRSWQYCAQGVRASRDWGLTRVCRLESIANASLRQLLNEHECGAKSSGVFRKAASIVEHGGMSLVYVSLEVADCDGGEALA